jgi:hypothetical protein
MPLIGLVQLRRALRGEIPLFDPIRKNGMLGDTETAAGRKWPVDLLLSESQFESDSWGVSKEHNKYHTRGLMSVQRCTRVARRNLARLAP